jgi:flagella basal body P-ring formation protein FlgA
MKKLPLVLATALLFALAAVPAEGATKAAGPIPSLKDSSTVEGEFVRLGDLIENAGDKANTPIFRAPELGATGTIQVYRIIEAARSNGVTVFDTRGISEVLITRASRTISVSDIERAVAETASKQTGMTDPNNIAVVFDSAIRPMNVEPNASTPRLAQFNYDPRSQRFDASLEVTGSSASRRKAPRISGYLYETVEIPTLIRAFTRSEIIRDEDIQMERRAKAELTPDTILKTTAIVGHAARRDLRAGAPIRVSELMKPELVGRGDTVTLSFESTGVRLVVRAKAMESGTEGDTIQVLNPQSKRTVQATVEGPGRVVVRPLQTARAEAPETTASVK